jgi:hypothetical protein
VANAWEGNMNRSTRRGGAVIALGLAFALVAAACTPPTGPTPVTWKVRPLSLTVVDGEDNDMGDEPYAIQVGFRSKLGVPGSSWAGISSQCRTWTLPAPDSARDGSTIAIPPGGADITFGQVQNLDIGDVLLELGSFEILGTLTFAAERDGVFWPSCALTDALESILVPTLAQSLELLIASSPVPPTQEQLVSLIVSAVGGFLNGLGSIIGAIIEGLGNPDDIIGVAAQIFLPTGGVLTDLLKTAFAIAGFFNPGLANGFLPLTELGSALKIRVGPLAPSVVDIPLTTPGIATYILRSAVVAG